MENGQRSIKRLVVAYETRFTQEPPCTLIGENMQTAIHHRKFNHLNPG